MRVEESRGFKLRMQICLYFQNTISKSEFYVLFWTVRLEIYYISYSPLSMLYYRTARKHCHFDNYSRLTNVTIIFLPRHRDSHDLT